MHTIDQKLVDIVILLGSRDSILQQLNRHLHRHDLPIFDVFLDHFAELTARSILLLAQQIPGGKMFETKVFH